MHRTRRPISHARPAAPPKRRRCAAALCLALALLHAPRIGNGAPDPVVFPCRDQPVLNALELRGPWQFRFDPKDQGGTNGWYEAITNSTAWESITLPRVWNIPDNAVTGNVAQTIGWYQLRVPVPPGWTQDVSLAFLGAQYTADVWVNDDYLGVHRGGFTPFFMDVTPQARTTNELRVAVRVSNITDNSTVPARHCGWQHYGGLCREVYLLHQPAVRPASITVTTRLLPDGACLASVETAFPRKPPAASRLRARLQDGKQVVAATEFAIPAGTAPVPAAELTVKTPRLWSPASPTLHQLTIEWEGGRHTMPVGLRTLRIDGERILLNESTLWLQGFGQHEAAPGNGPIVPRELRRRDLEMMQRLFDANVIRPGHYPNHPDLYNLCDELGLLVFAEIPLWQMWGVPLAADDIWSLWLEPQLRDMMQSLQHHPSVMAWGIGNETRGAHDYYRRAAAFVRPLDPTRPISVVLESWMDTDSAPLFDLQARNAHFGWYHSTDVYDGPERLAPVLAATRGKPFWITETGGMAGRGSLGGGYSGQARGTETYLDRILRFNFTRYSTLTNPITGVMAWSWADYPRNGGIEPHGILDVARQPKLIAYTLSNLMHGDLRLYTIEESPFVATGKTWRATLQTFNRPLTPRRNLTARWTVLKGQTRVGGDEISFNATPDRSQTVAPIEWTPPTHAPPGLYTVWTELLADGQRLHLGCNAFDLYATSCPGILRIPPPGDAGNTKRWIAINTVRLPVHPFIGLQIPLEAGTYDITFGEDEQTSGPMACTIRNREITTQAWPSS